MKRKVLIIGAGQLGSRHLQGILKLNLPVDVYVVDSSEKSLLTARQRANEINHNHIVNYFTDLTNLPLEFDLVIIATSSNVREKIIYQLLDRCQVKFLILEKVLFTEIDAFERVEKLIQQSNIKTWVNHPRRMFQVYHSLKKEMSLSPKVFQVTGGNWGLGCNALHFIDLFVFLSESQVKTIDTEWVDSTILESKREGFIEFTGSIKGMLNDSSTFQISSLKGEISAGTITIFDTNKRYIIQESGTPQIITMNSESQFQPIFSPFIMEFQSGLTTNLADDIFKFGNCDLPTYNEAMQTHKIFITALLQKYNSITGLNSKSLPIT